MIWSHRRDVSADDVTIIINGKVFPPFPYRKIRNRKNAPFPRIHNWMWLSQVPKMDIHLLLHMRVNKAVLIRTRMHPNGHRTKSIRQSGRLVLGKGFVSTRNQAHVLICMLKSISIPFPPKINWTISTKWSDKRQTAKVVINYCSIFQTDIARTQAIDYIARRQTTTKVWREAVDEHQCECCAVCVH